MCLVCTPLVPSVRWSAIVSNARPVLPSHVVLRSTHLSRTYGRQTSHLHEHIHSVGQYLEYSRLIPHAIHDITPPSPIHRSQLCHQEIPISHMTAALTIHFVVVEGFQQRHALFGFCCSISSAADASFYGKIHFAYIIQASVTLQLMLLLVDLRVAHSMFCPLLTRLVWFI